MREDPGVKSSSLAERGSDPLPNACVLSGVVVVEGTGIFYVERTCYEVSMLSNNARNKT